MTARGASRSLLVAAGALERPGRHRLLLCAGAFACVFALKLGYTQSGAEDLRWILGPTTAIVECLTGRPFEFEPGAGYLDRRDLFLIAPSCSGVNFLMTAFLMLSITWIFRAGSGRRVWFSLPAAAAAAYACTLVANAIRISLAMAMQEGAVSVGPLTPAGIHRIEGIVIYFGGLLLLYRLISRRRHSGFPWIPLLAYYLLTLGLPFLNGAFLQGARFWLHATWVLVIPLLIVLLTQVLSRFLEVEKKLLQLRGQRDAEDHGPSGPGMDEAEHVGVEGQP